MVTESGSPKALTASSKVTPCFFQLPEAFAGSHENTNAMTQHCDASWPAGRHHRISRVIQFPFLTIGEALPIFLLIG